MKIIICVIITLLIAASGVALVALVEGHTKIGIVKKAYIL
jgi:hypothetical protein